MINSFIVIFRIIFLGLLAVAASPKGNRCWWIDKFLLRESRSVFKVQQRNYRRSRTGPHGGLTERNRFIMLVPNMKLEMPKIGHMSPEFFLLFLLLKTWLLSGTGMARLPFSAHTLQFNLFAYNAAVGIEVRGTKRVREKRDCNWN